MTDIFLCGPTEMQEGDYPWFWPPCPHPDVEDGICCTCLHRVG